MSIFDDCKSVSSTRSPKKGLQAYQGAAAVEPLAAKVRSVREAVAIVEDYFNRMAGEEIK